MCVYITVLGGGFTTDRLHLGVMSGGPTAKLGESLRNRMLISFSWEHFFREPLSSCLGS